MGYYKESGKLNIIFTLLILPVALALIALTAYGYVTLSYINPFIYVNLIMTALYGILVSLFIKMVIEGGKIRSVKIVFLISFLFSVFAVYAMWVGHIAYVLDLTFVEATSDLVTYVHLLSYQTFSISRLTSSLFEVTQGSLYIFWGVEALIVLIVPVVTIYFMRNVDGIFCEDCNIWARGECILRKKSKENLTKEKVEVLVSGSNLNDLMEMSDAEKSFGSYYEFHFSSCLRCKSTYYVKVEKVYDFRSEDGQITQIRDFIFPFYEIDAHKIPKEIKDNTINSSEKPLSEL